MLFTKLLYALTIKPLELFFEHIFVAAMHFSHKNPGVSILMLSLAMNFLVLPLYRRADKLQEEQSDTDKRLAPGIKHIKSAFKGEERFLMLQEYYRQNNYKPTDALRGSMSLFLEIPFFIAAYNFLSGLEILKGVKFGPIKDLGAPDKLLVIGGLTLNALPILMTLINIISGAVYTHGMALKSKIQLYGMALIFLFFLYKSPAGLVFYWTLNNIFSLFKNIAYKIAGALKKSKSGAAAEAAVNEIDAVSVDAAEAAVNEAAVSVITSDEAAVFDGFQESDSVKEPSSMGEASNPASKTKKPKKKTPPEPAPTSLFRWGCVLLALFIGLFIPIDIVASSPQEFVDLWYYRSPFVYLLVSFAVASGLFIVWFGVFYALAGERVKKIFSCAVWLLAGMAAFNWGTFNAGLGTINSFLVYSSEWEIGKKALRTNTICVIGLMLIMLVVYLIRKQIVKFVYYVGTAAVVVVILYFTITMNHSMRSVKKLATQYTKDPVIELSKTEKNVVVIMLDRGMGMMVPYIFGERPELKEKFRGFTWYSDTITFGTGTNFATAGVFGGYEYTPLEMNKRKDEKLEKKQNEALKVMPMIFAKAGFNVTVTDPSYAGYQWIPDISIYDDCPGVSAHITKGRYTSDGGESTKKANRMRERNLFLYSLMKAMPAGIQGYMYADGLYNEADLVYGGGENELVSSNVQTRNNGHDATGIDKDFADTISVLQNLPNMTEINESDKGGFLMMGNEATHEPCLLQTPDYVISDKVDNWDYDNSHKERWTVDGRTMKMTQIGHYTTYHVNMAAYIELGKWFDYLREQGVFDNTKIILVSDHGSSQEQFPELLMDHDADIEWLNALLMVKDFNSNGEFKTSEELMTNADAPQLAVKDVIENPVNPFTGKIINDDSKKAGDPIVFYSTKWRVTENNGNQFIPGDWWSVHGDIHDKKNWTYRGHGTEPEN
ncbi:MAG: YidC/Oxa1 family membrane protein insertase [Lachnospiraceae bacterium]|nr:YidC/Oxa1 family membrane protein insertase [Lachnospiraceae bacterium]